MYFPVPFPIQLMLFLRQYLVLPPQAPVFLQMWNHFLSPFLSGEVLLIWIGGMGVLVFLLSLLPLAGGYHMNLMRAESPGPSVSKLVPKVQSTAKSPLQYLSWNDSYTDPSPAPWGNACF